MFDVLVFVYEHCRRADLVADPDRVARQLSAAGFGEADITAALAWLAGISRTPRRAPAPLPAQPRSFRAFAPREVAKLEMTAQGFLVALEQAGILTPQSRELVLERALATSDYRLGIDQIRLIVLMVLWNQSALTSQLVAEELRSEGRERRPH